MRGEKLILLIARVLLIALGLGAEFAGAQPLARNVIQLTALSLIFILSFRDRAPAVDLPFPRNKYFAPVVIIGAALATAAQTWNIGYFGDDFATITRARSAATPLDWLTPGDPSAGHFLRPVAWWCWWAWERITPGSPVAGRVFSILLFALSAWLLRGALRRLGIRRGVASAAALIFAVHSTGLGTIAWLSNLYSQLSLIFALAAIVSIPKRNINIKSLAIPLALFCMALLSKEDVALLCIPAAWAASHGRLRLWRRGAFIFVAFALVLALTTILRFVTIGSAGQYHEGTPIYTIGRWPGALADLILHDFPGRCWLPLRNVFVATGARPPESIYGIPLIIWLCMGGLAPGARRAVTVGILLLVAGIAPVVPLARMGDDLTNIRLYYFPTTGVVLILAGAIAGLRRLAAVRWVFIGIGCAITVRHGMLNLTSVYKSAEIHDQAFRDVAAAARALPQNAKIQIDGLRTSREGVQLFGGAYPYGFEQRCGRHDLEFVHSDPGRFDLCLEFDPRTERIVNPLRDDGARAFAAVSLNLNNPWKLQFDDSAAGASALTRMFSIDAQRLHDFWNVRATDRDRYLRLPPMRVPSPCRVQLIANGRFENVGAVDASAAGRLPARILYQRGNLIIREDMIDGIAEIPAEAQTIQLELVPRARDAFLLKSVEVRVIQ